MPGANPTRTLPNPELDASVNPTVYMRKMDSVITRPPAAPLLLIVALAGLIAAVACGTASQGGQPTLAEPTADASVPEVLADLIGDDSLAPAVEPSTEPGIETRQVGRNVGDLVLSFTISGEDGAEQSSAELVQAGKPVFMFFFATWCPVCRRELSQLKDIYPEFASELDFIAIGQDPTEPLSDLVELRDNQGHPWHVALPGRRMLADLRITSQSYKIAFDSDGVIVYRAGYGGGDIETWKAVMAELASR